MVLQGAISLLSKRREICYYIVEVIFDYEPLHRGEGKASALERENRFQQLKIAALLLAAGVFLPFLGDLVSFGDRLLLSQIPVLMTGLLCGMPYGAAVGLLTPLLTYLITAEPAFYPGVMVACASCAVMGAAVSPVFRTFTRGAASIYASLALALVSSRAAALVLDYVLLELEKQPYSVTGLIRQECLYGWPGVLLQLLAIPVLTLGAERLGLLE